MPSVAQVSSPSACTSRTMAATFSRSLCLGERQAAPMQKRVAPAARAARARSMTVSSGSSASLATPVSKRMLCGQ